jgi:hypothetical protein
MSDQNCLTHRLKKNTSSSKEKQIKEEVKNNLYNYNNSSVYFYSLIK